MFDMIFNEVMTELGLTGWWELFDSEMFDIVEIRIAIYYDVVDAADIDGYLDWYNTMAMDL